MNGILIGEVARLTGLQPSALRYYERIGLVPPPQRQNGRRRYDPSVVGLITLIKLAKQAGFTMADIHTLLHGFASDTPPSDRWTIMAQAKLQELAAQIANLHRMELILHHGLGCDCLRLEDCIVVLEDAQDPQGPLCTSGPCSGDAP